MNNKAPHILNTSTNLLGFCLIVLTSIKVARFNHATIIDDSTGAASLLLMGSCILSFLSMRKEEEKENRSKKLEKIADYCFLLALVCISITIVFVSFNLLK